MRYRELDESAYRQACVDIIRSVEGFKSRVYDLHDRKATIGYGYTFNRSNNLEPWQKARVSLSPAVAEHLKMIDEADRASKTAIAMDFKRSLTEEEASNLLLQGTLFEY